MTRLITFATDNMSIAAQICKESALANNVDEVKVYGPGDLNELQQKVSWSFNETRGYGYWVWKAYLMHRELNKMKGGEIIIYADAGVEFVNNANHVIDRMSHDVWLFGNMWEHEHWCKRDAIKRIYPNGKYGKQVQASVILVRATEASRKFLEDWCYYCSFQDLIDDSPGSLFNHPEYREHRHDQALITCLAYRDNIPLHWWPAMYNAGNFTYEKTGYTDNYPVLFHHFRMRNEQFISKDDLDIHMQAYFFKKYPDVFQRIIKQEWWLKPNEKRIPV